MRRLSIIACLAAGVVVTASPARAAEAAVVNPDAIAPSPNAQPLDSAGEGRRQFLKLNCYGCHGMAAGGGMGPRIVGRSRDVVAAALAGGRPGGMPSFAAYVRDIDVTNITNYLASIGKPGEPTFNDWWVAVPPK